MTMAIKIKRNTGWLGSLAGFRVIIDDEDLTRLRSDKQMNLDIPEAMVQVSYFSSKSNWLKVLDGDELEIIKTKWWNFSPLLFSLIIAGIMLIPEMQLRLISTFLVFGVMYALHYFGKGMDYKVSIVNSNE